MIRYVFVSMAIAVLLGNAPLIGAEQPTSNPLIASAFEDATQELTTTDEQNTAETERIPKILKKFPAIPQESGIQNFPAPIAETEQDAKTLATFYESAATAYVQAAEKAQASSVTAYERMQHLKTLGNMHTFRTEELTSKTSEFITNFGQNETSAIPPKSAKHLPSRLSAKHLPSRLLQGNITNYRQSHQEAALLAEELLLKSIFYTTMAEKISPDKGEIAATESTDRKTNQT